MPPSLVSEFDILTNYRGGNLSYTSVATLFPPTVISFRIRHMRSVCNYQKPLVRRRSEWPIINRLAFLVSNAFLVTLQSQIFLVAVARYFLVLFLPLF